MSSVLDAIRRVLGRERGTRPDAGASSEAASLPQAGAAAPALPPTAAEPALAVPGDEAQLPIQPTAPPIPSMSMPDMSSLPIMTARPTAAEPPAEASAVLESTEVERAAEPLGQEREPERAVPGVRVEDMVQPSVSEEVPVAGQATAIEDTGGASIVEGPVVDREGQGQALAAEPPAPSDSPQFQQFPQFSEPPESVESATATQPTRVEQSPEQQMAVESLESPESPTPDEN